MSVTNKTRGVIERITIKQSQRWRWYHGIAFYIIVQALTFGLSGLTGKIRGNKSKNLREAVFGDVSYFKMLKQSVITPPSSVFGPAWTINNLSTIYGNLRVLNMSKDTPGREPYLAWSNKPAPCARVHETQAGVPPLRCRIGGGSSPPPTPALGFTTHRPR